VLLSLNYGATKGYDPQIFWLLRVPRTISAVAVGGALAVAGALVQASLGNPLADPYTTGIASAAALGAVVGSLFPGHPLITSGFFAFWFSVGGLFILATWLRKSFRYATEVLLAGIVVGFFFSAAAMLVMALSDPAAWSSAILWLLGTLGQLSLSESVATLCLLLVTCTLGWMHWKPLDLISVDELTAESAGLDVANFRKRVFIIVALITAISVSVSGVIGFLGLIIPHVLRKAGIRSHLFLIPTAFLAGASFLLVCDVIARVIVRPAELPVGVVMAIVGAPLFLMIAKGRSAT